MLQTETRENQQGKRSRCECLVSWRSSGRSDLCAAVEKKGTIALCCSKGFIWLYSSPRWLFSVEKCNKPNHLARFKIEQSVHGKRHRSTERVQYKQREREKERERPNSRRTRVKKDDKLIMFHILYAYCVCLFVASFYKPPPSPPVALSICNALCFLIAFLLFLGVKWSCAGKRQLEAVCWTQDYDRSSVSKS